MNHEKDDGTRDLDAFFDSNNVNLGEMKMISAFRRSVLFIALAGMTCPPPMDLQGLNAASKDKSHRARQDCMGISHSEE